MASNFWQETKVRSETDNTNAMSMITINKINIKTETKYGVFFLVKVIFNIEYLNKCLQMNHVFWAFRLL